MTPSDKLYHARLAFLHIQHAIEAMEAGLHEVMYDEDLQKGWNELDTIRSAKAKGPTRTIRLTPSERMDDVDGFTRTGFGDL